MGAFRNELSIEGDVYIQRLATYIRRNEEALANGLLCFSKTRTLSKVKPLRPSFTIHHLYYITERIANSSLDVHVGALNIKLDTPNHEPTFISFMANKARNQKNFDTDAKSITSINSVKSIVSSASLYWMSFSFSKDPKIIQKAVKYLYSSFTKIPCLVLSPHTEINSIDGYEEYPCDTCLPLRMFKNLQVLELVEYEPHEVYGWHTLSEKLRILIIRKTKVSDLAEILFSLVIDDENGRSSFSSSRQSRKLNTDFSFNMPESSHMSMGHTRSRLERTLPPPLLPPRSRKESTQGTKENRQMHLNTSCNYMRHPKLSEAKWNCLKQLTVSQSIINTILPHAFEPLTNLAKLNLAGNLLDDLPDGLYHLQNIKYLNFADNFIKDLKKLPLNLKHLTIINLNNNKLECIEGIQRLKSVQKIDLRRNKLSSVAQLRGLVQLVSLPSSQLDNVKLSNNKLPRSYRADLLNLFNGAKPQNNVKIDDSRPGYFESALLLDPEAVVKRYKKFMNIDLLEKQGVERHNEQEQYTVEQVSFAVPAPSKEVSIVPQVLERRQTAHRITSASEVLESLTKLDIQGIENAIANRKHNSVMSAASSTTDGVSKVYIPPHLINSAQSSPSMKAFTKTVMPLHPNQNLCNQPHYPSAKLPSMVRQYLYPKRNLSCDGSEISFRSSATTLHKIDLESASAQNPAPNVITAVQVQVEGF